MPLLHHPRRREQPRIARHKYWFRVAVAERLELGSQPASTGVMRSNGNSAWMRSTRSGSRAASLPAAYVRSRSFNSGSAAEGRANPTAKA